MIISGWHINGYGVFRDFKVENIGPGLTIIYGDNEAGKSTLLAFIRFVLFGPARDDGQYEPQQGGRHGGRLYLQDEAQGLWVLERLGGRKSKPLLLHGDGTPAKEADLSRLTGGVDGRLFRAVFAFSLRELSQLSSLNEAGIREQIFSAGITGAGASAARVRQALDKEAQQLLKPRSLEGRINRLIAELRQVDQALRQAQAEARSYEALIAEEEQAGRLIRQLDEEIERLEGERRLYEELLRLWQPWNERNLLLKEVEGMSDAEGFPRDMEKRMEGLRQDLAKAKEYLRARREEKERLLAELSSIRLRPELERIALDVKALAEEITLQQRRMEESQAKRLRASQLTARLEALLSSLGPGWDRARLRAFLLTVAMSDELSSWQERLAECRRRTVESAAMAREAESRAEAAARETEAARQDLLRFSACPTLIEIAAQRQRLEAINQRILGRKAAASRVFTLAVICAALMTLGFTAWERGWGSGGLVLLGLGAISGVVASFSAARDWVRETLALTRLLNEAGLGPDFDPLGLEEVRKTLAEKEPVAVRRIEAERRLEELEREHRRLLEAAREARSAAASAAREENDLVAQWAEWKRIRRLPETLTPQGAKDFINTIREALAVEEELTRTEAGRDGDEKEIDRWRKRAEAAFAVAGQALQYGHDLLAAVRALAAEVDEACQSRRRVADIERRLEELAPALHEAEKRVESILADHRRTLEEAGTEDDQSFDRLAEKAARRAELVQRALVLGRSIDARLGDGAYGERLREHLENGDPAIWEAALEGVRSRLRELRQNRDEAIAARREAEVRRQELEKSADIPSLAAWQAALKAQLEEAVRRWMVIRLAQGLINRTLYVFVRERQPEVLKMASRCFERFTGGRYIHIQQDIPDGETVTVTERSGRRKTPEELSRGTAEQLYLALRFGLVDSFARRSVSLPLVLDDVLVNFDPKRAKAVLEVFSDYLHAGHRQILLFTCHPETRALAEGVLEHCRVIELGEAFPAAYGWVAKEQTAVAEEEKGSGKRMLSYGAEG